MRTIGFYNFTGFLTLLKREVDRFFKVYIQTLLAPLLSNLLFLGVFGGMMSTRDAGLEGVSYLQFLVPGLSAMGAIMSAFQNPAFSLISRKYQGTLQDLNSYPLSVFEKTLAFVLGGTIRGVLIGTLTYGATIFFVGYKIAYPPLFILSLFNISFVFASLGTIAGLYIKNFDRMNFIVTIILTPLAYFGGVFFEISRLPEPLAALANFNPLFPLIHLTRFSYLGIHEGNLLISGLYLVVIMAGAFYLAFRTFKQGVGLRS